MPGTQGEEPKDQPGARSPALPAGEGTGLDPVSQGVRTSPSQFCIWGEVQSVQTAGGRAGGKGPQEGAASSQACTSPVGSFLGLPPTGPLVPPPPLPGAPLHLLRGTYCFMARSLESMLSCFPFMSCTSVSNLVTLSWRIFMSSFFRVDT